MILFVGQSASEEDMKKIADLNWYMIFTTKRDVSSSANMNALDVPNSDFDKLCDIFKNKKKEVRIITPGNEVESTDGILNIIKISNDGEEINFFSESSDFSTDQYKGILSNLLINKHNDLIVLGFDEKKDKGSELYDVLWKISNKSEKKRGKIVFWNSDVNEKAKKILEDAQIIFCETSLSQAFEKSGISLKKTDNVLAENDDFFYCLGHRISIDKSTLPGIRSDTELLTEKFIYQKIPIGKIALKDAFWEYILPDRYTFPKWFGYFPKSRFYIDRTEIDEKLYQRVVKALKNGSEEPIILYGEPCSGKTCAIGALAYRIYTEHQYPVVFIHPQDSEVVGVSAREINELLAIIDDKTTNIGDKTTDKTEKNILLIWDSSAEIPEDNKNNHDISEDKKNDDVPDKKENNDEIPKNISALYNQLVNNYGRRVVMVGTSYKYESCKKSKSKKSKKQLVIERKIEKKEDFLKKLEKVLRDYNVMENKYISCLINKYESIPDLEDIALLFDDLTTLFDEFFSKALKLEQHVLTDYVIDQLNKKREMAGFESFNNPFSKLSKAELAFFDDDDEETDKEKDSEEEKPANMEKQKKQFEIFNLCISLFGQIDMKIASPIAFYFFPEMELQKIEYIPWLRYHYLDDSNIFYICFRSAREAQLHLKNYFQSSNEEPKNIVKFIIREIISYFKNDIDAQMSDFIKKSIVDFLRYYGPNKISYTNSEYNNYKIKPGNLDELKEIINPIYDLLASYDDKDGSFSIIYATYNHEFFRELLKSSSVLSSTENDTDKMIKSMEQSMEQLQKTIGICKKAIDQVNESVNKNFYPYTYLNKQRNSLITEQTICDTLLKQCQTKYLSACTKNNKEPDKKWSNVLVSKNFDDIYRQISGIITCDPENDYFYNALFQSFEAYVDMEKMKGRSVDVGHIVKMGILIDEGNNNLPSQCTGTGSEFWSHIENFNNLSSTPLTIDDVKNGNLGSYQKYYDDIKTKAGVIMYACRNTYDIKKVFDFLNENDINTAMKKNYYANEFMLRVTWEYFTGKKFVFTDECQCVGLKNEQWKVLYDICSDYIENTRSGQNQTFIRKPTILLVYALAMLQTGKGNHLETIKFIKTNITEEIFFNNNVRMRTPFIFCNSDGVPLKYNGTVIGQDYKKNTGNVKIGNFICRCNCHNINAKDVPVPGTRMNNLELGLGYTGFSIYTEEGRVRKQVKNQNGNK